MIYNDRDEGNEFETAETQLEIERKDDEADNESEFECEEKTKVWKMRQYG